MSFKIHQPHGEIGKLAVAADIKWFEANPDRDYRLRPLWIGELPRAEACRYTHVFLGLALEARQIVGIALTFPADFNYTKYDNDKHLGEFAEELLKRLKEAKKRGQS